MASGPNGPAPEMPVPASSANPIWVCTRISYRRRRAEKLGWNVDLTNEMLVLVVRLWLTHTVPPPDAQAQAAKAMGRKRWDGFLRSLTRNMEQDSRIGADISQDIAARAASDQDD